MMIEQGCAPNCFSIRDYSTAECKSTPAKNAGNPGPSTGKPGQGSTGLFFWSQRQILPEPDAGMPQPGGDRLEPLAGNGMKRIG